MLSLYVFIQPENRLQFLQSVVPDQLYFGASCW